MLATASQKVTRSKMALQLLAGHRVRKRVFPRLKSRGRIEALMQCPVEHDRLMNRRRGTWMHQMSIHGWEDHPQLGEIWYVLNQWGLNAHGTCPSGAPRGGFWIRRRDLAEIVSQFPRLKSRGRIEAYDDLNPRDKIIMVSTAEKPWPN